ncbi:uncharacterized protein CLUP02_05211 [Colletotrichum lupini]|uniref:Uncharacterized protein n=1 Tax=Colletotrichum lupini TaxID=145971 RepID=A0A9Q8WE10_9PEZI|nr:uncharacterized protein CLUP02_05211 [Colletotrichum lupini]UQC79731.1 hypothetical protein CLUP02_05211 [Colletotrichum lupini]
MHRLQSPTTSDSLPLCFWFHSLRAGRLNQQTGTTRCRRNLTNTGTHGFPRIFRLHPTRPPRALRDLLCQSKVLVLDPDPLISSYLDGFSTITVHGICLSTENRSVTTRCHRPWSRPLGSGKYLALHDTTQLSNSSDNLPDTQKPISATYCRRVMSRMSRTAGDHESAYDKQICVLQISTENTRQLTVGICLFALPRRRHPQQLFPSFISIARFEPPCHSAPSSFRHLYIFHTESSCPLQSTRSKHLQFSYGHASSTTSMHAWHGCRSAFAPIIPLPFSSSWSSSLFEVLKSQTFDASTSKTALPLPGPGLGTANQDRMPVTSIQRKRELPMGTWNGSIRNWDPRQSRSSSKCYPRPPFAVTFEMLFAARPQHSLDVSRLYGNDKPHSGFMREQLSAGFCPSAVASDTVCHVARCPPTGNVALGFRRDLALPPCLGLWNPTIQKRVASLVRYLARLGLARLCVMQEVVPLLQEQTTGTSSASRNRGIRTLSREPRRPYFVLAGTLGWVNYDRTHATPSATQPSLAPPNECTIYPGVASTSTQITSRDSCQPKIPRIDGLDFWEYSRDIHFSEASVFCRQLHSWEFEVILDCCASPQPERLRKHGTMQSKTAHSSTHHAFDDSGAVPNQVMRSHNATGQSLEPLISTFQLHLMEQSRLWEFPNLHRVSKLGSPDLRGKSGVFAAASTSTDGTERLVDQKGSVEQSVRSAIFFDLNRLDVHPTGIPKQNGKIILFRPLRLAGAASVLFQIRRIVPGRVDKVDITAFNQPTRELGVGWNKQQMAVKKAGPWRDQADYGVRSMAYENPLAAVQLFPTGAVGANQMRVPGNPLSSVAFSLSASAAVHIRTTGAKAQELKARNEIPHYNPMKSRSEWERQLVACASRLGSQALGSTEPANQAWREGKRTWTLRKTGGNLGARCIANWNSPSSHMRPRRNAEADRASNTICYFVPAYGVILIPRQTAALGHPFSSSANEAVRYCTSPAAAHFLSWSSVAAEHNKRLFRSYNKGEDILPAAPAILPPTGAAGRISSPYDKQPAACEGFEASDYAKYRNDKKMIWKWRGSTAITKLNEALRPKSQRATRSLVFDDLGLRGTFGTQAVLCSHQEHLNFLGPCNPPRSQQEDGVFGSPVDPWKSYCIGFGHSRPWIKPGACFADTTKRLSNIIFSRQLSIETGKLLQDYSTKSNTDSVDIPTPQPPGVE